MAVLAPFAHFGVLETLVMRADATATVNNITASDGLFRIAIAAFLIVTMLDLLVAWAWYVLLRPVNGTSRSWWAGCGWPLPPRSCRR
jgi:hypothetical protein